MTRLLMVDDDQDFCHLMKEYLDSEGFEVDLAHNGQDGIDQLDRTKYDLMILDVMMPIKNGFDTLSEVRKTVNIPVIMLTARGEDVDRIVGLEMGADDYLGKPCNPRELVARVRAILRRASNETNKNQVEHLEIGELKLNRNTFGTHFHDTKVDLTGAEFKVLAVLVEHAGEVVTKADLSEQGLGKKLTAYDRSIDVHISNIRKKLQQISPIDDMITNIRGVGYLLKRLDS